MLNVYTAEHIQSFISWVNCFHTETSKCSLSITILVVHIIIIVSRSFNVMYEPFTVFVHELLHTSVCQVTQEVL